MNSADQIITGLTIIINIWIFVIIIISIYLIYKLKKWTFKGVLQTYLKTALKSICLIIGHKVYKTAIVKSIGPLWECKRCNYKFIREEK